MGQTFCVKLWIQFKWITERRDIAHVEERIEKGQEWLPNLDFQDHVGEIKVILSAGIGIHYIALLTRDE